MIISNLLTIICRKQLVHLNLKLVIYKQDRKYNLNLLPLLYSYTVMPQVGLKPSVGVKITNIFSVKLF